MSGGSAARDFARQLGDLAGSGAKVDDFDVNRLRLRVGPPTIGIGKEWTAEGDTATFTVTTKIVGAFDLTTFTMPGHDPPVAWRLPWSMGFEVIACPAMPLYGVAATNSPRYMDPEPIILDHEPGRLP